MSRVPTTSRKRKAKQAPKPRPTPPATIRRPADLFLPPLRVAIIDGRTGEFRRFAELPDPRPGFCKAFNGLDVGEWAVLAGEEPETNEYLYAVVSLHDGTSLARHLNREAADGYAFGYNGAAINEGSDLRAAVIAEVDLANWRKGGAA